MKQVKEALEKEGIKVPIEINIPETDLSELDEHSPITTKDYETAKSYATREWSLSWSPTLEKVYGDKFNMEIERTFKNALLNVKLDYIKRSKAKAVEHATNNMPF